MTRLREVRRGEELTNGKEVRNPSNRQRGHEERPTTIVEVARANRQRDAQCRAEKVHSPRGSELHYSPVPVRKCDAASSRSRHQPLEGSDSTYVNACTV